MVPSGSLPLFPLQCEGSHHSPLYPQSSQEANMRWCSSQNEPEICQGLRAGLGRDREGHFRLKFEEGKALEKSSFERRPSWLRMHGPTIPPLRHRDTFSPQAAREPAGDHDLISQTWSSCVRADVPVPPGVIRGNLSLSSDFCFLSEIPGSGYKPRT